MQEHIKWVFLQLFFLLIIEINQNRVHLSKISGFISQKRLSLFFG
jgi:hypothetical protein